VAGLLLALIDLPDFGTPLRRMAGSLERIADRAAADPTADTIEPRPSSDRGAADFRGSVSADHPPAGGGAEAPEKRRARSGPNQELIDA
jgi:hypothetical protein